MDGFWGIASATLILDLFSPGVFAAVLFACSTLRPMLVSACLLLAFTLTNVTLGMLVLFGLDWLIDIVRNEIERTIVNPTQADFVLSFFLGLVMLFMAVRARGKERPKTAKTSALLPETPAKAVLTGILLCLMSAPLAVPYLAMVTQLSSYAGDDNELAIVVLLGYNALWSLPFLMIPVVFRLYGDKAARMIANVRTRIGLVFSKGYPWLLAGLGSLLVVDAVLYFVTGSGII